MVCARTTAQSLGNAFKTMTAPHQYALHTSTVHTGSDLFVLISRASMLSAMRNAPGCDDALLFVLQFYGQPSSFFWEDEMGEVHDILQGEGGEQGDNSHCAEQEVPRFLGHLHRWCSRAHGFFCMHRLSRLCGTTRKSESIRGRRNCGTVQVFSPLVASTSWKQGGEPFPR